MYRAHIKALVLLIFFGLLAGVIFLWRVITDWLCGGSADEESVAKGHDTDDEPKPAKKGFFVNFQTRRRKLNLFRSGNVISDGVGKKLEKQRQGMFGRKKRK